MSVTARASHPLLRRLPSFLPTGRSLRPEEFALRHRGILVLLWLHVPSLAVFGVLRGYGVVHSLGEAAVIAAFATTSQYASGQRLKALTSALGLVVSSSVLVHLWGGAIEGHFHFFVVMTVLALYQSWLPFMAALGFIVLEHGLLGALAASSVYAHQAGNADPWTWALIHGGFVLASCIGNLLAWRLTEHEALHDGLTGLANRVLLLDALEGRLRQEGATVVFLDLDGFKDVNDGFGHDVGDRLLVAVSRRLAARVRPGDVLARLGGDEFAVVLATPDHASALRAAQRLLSAFDEPFGIGDLSLSPSASAGVARALPDNDATSLLHDADLAMYAAKRVGGSRCALFELDLRTTAARRSALIAEFPRALREQEFVVHYQPVFDLADDRTVGVEALVRWEHPSRGCLGPVEFIEAAEQSGYIVPLGKHVLREACRQAVLWRDELPGQPELVMSVNLSPRQLAESDLVATVAAALSDSGLAAGSLCLEVTEGVVIHELDVALPTLQALSALGVQLALDDFGTGYSSLSYLQRLPVQVLKVDRSFVAALGQEGGDTAILRAVVDLAHQLGLAVTAEGIETTQQLAALRVLSCETGQGYLRARPASAQETGARLAEERLVSRIPGPRPAGATAAAGYVPVLGPRSTA